MKCVVHMCRFTSIVNGLYAFGKMKSSVSQETFGDKEVHGRALIRNPDKKLANNKTGLQYTSKHAVCYGFQIIEFLLSCTQNQKPFRVAHKITENYYRRSTKTKSKQRLFFLLLQLNHQRILNMFIRIFLLIIT